MLNIIIYWGTSLIGYIIGSKTKEKTINTKLLDLLPMIIIAILVFTMGMRMGSNEEITSKLASIGLLAFGYTVILMIGAVLSVTILRRVLGFDNRGRLKKNKANDENQSGNLSAQGDDGESNYSTSILILVSVVLGLIIGYFYVRINVSNLEKFYDITGMGMMVVLCILLGTIGFTMGRSDVIARNLKHLGFKVALFPVVVLIGTSISAIVCAFVFSISIRESLAIGYGFGWYSLAPITITNAGFHFAGAISFLHNVFREMTGLMLIPILANKIGFIEITAMPGVAAMDIGMSIIERSTRQDIIVYSFLIGLTEGLLVPVLVPTVLELGFLG